MLRIVDTILALSGLIIVFVIGIIIYLQTPDTFNNLTSWQWPGANKVKEEIIIENPYAYEQLLSQGEGLEIVKRHCTGCHSERLITQNRMSRDRWADNIIWMQETQGLWDLGSELDPVLDYLATHYAPIAVGRRSNLEEELIDWYELDE